MHLASLAENILLHCRLFIDLFVVLLFGLLACRYMERKVIMIRNTLILFILSLTISTNIWALPSRPSSQKIVSSIEKDYTFSNRYRIRLVTMGPGNWLFTYFGHNALEVLNRDSGRGSSYNFGTFSVAKPLDLLQDYLQFRLRYWLSVTSPRVAFIHYRHEDRGYTVQDLKLSQHETTVLVKHLQNHALPQNQFFPYHHYTNNCSTKVRDALSLAIGPVFKEMAQKRQGHSYRSNVRQATQPNKILMILMDFAMGPYSDQPQTLWEDMFLPEYVQSYVADPVWVKLRGQPLASPIQTLYQRKASPPWNWKPEWIVASLAFLWILLGVASGSGQWFRRWFRFSILLMALLGSLLAFMMFFTKMPEPPKNANLLVYHPLLWILWWCLRKSIGKA